jgi:hypothetical protein
MSHNGRFFYALLNSSRRIFSVLAGIDEYQCLEIKTLQGCVNDCENVDKWLKANFTQPKTTILKNKKATRVQILEAIKALAKDDEIEKNDPILIFLAGHGAEATPLPEWKLPSKRNVQMFLPHDFSCGKASSTLVSVPQHIV